MTPAAVAVYTDRGIFSDGKERIRDWRIRIFPNLYAAVTTTPKPPTTDWVALSGYGSHEVLVDSPRHQDSPADFNLQQMLMMLNVYRDRYNYYRHMSGINYISLFKNHGAEAGASLSHTHSQLVALPIMPPLLIREMFVISSSSVCPYCSVVEREMNSNRLIIQNENWIQIAPFFSKAPYETWILPKGHISNLGAINNVQMEDLASIMSSALKSLRSLLNDPPYNYMLFQVPSIYHFNIRIQPVLSKTAGFERGTDIFINPMSPEQAAIEMRNA
jgi:UDPglucose--hexose-1-phosphate uridylyltransferase